MDFSVFLSLLGVVLTIATFFLGYRQTIGARKERARAANKDLVSTLFKRLTLEKSFQTNIDGIERISSGFAIDSRVKRTDIYALDELEDILSAKIVESDYIDEQERVGTLSRLASCFAEPDEDRNGYASNLPDLVFNASGERERRSATSFRVLTLFSAITGLLATLVASMYFIESGKLTGSQATLSFTNIGAVTFAVAFTSVLLGIFVRLRDSSRYVASTVEISPEAFERSFYRHAKRISKSFRIAPMSWLDFQFDTPETTVGIEYKYDLNKMNAGRVSELISKLESQAGDNLPLIYLVSGVTPNDRLVKQSTSKVKVVSTPQMMSILREADRRQV